MYVLGLERSTIGHTRHAGSGVTHPPDVALIRSVRSLKVFFHRSTPRTGIQWASRARVDYRRY